MNKTDYSKLKRYFERVDEGTMCNLPPHFVQAAARKFLKGEANLKCFYEDDLPKVFIAIYNDGSGCDIFHEVSDGFYSTPVGVENVQSDWFADAGYLWFVPLPDDFEVWEACNVCME